LTNVEIDPNLPLRLLFLINASSHEKIIEEKDREFQYTSGGLEAVGKKLIELELQNPAPPSFAIPEQHLRSQTIDLKHELGSLKSPSPVRNE
jgi:hypothetical protein